MKDLVNLFKNIDSKIKTAAAMQDLFEIMDKVVSSKGKKDE